jgi:AraC family transcriptional regulator, ethanolamine operon transcriptional activator
MSRSESIDPGFRRLVHRLEDPEEFGHAVSGGCLAADFLAPREAATHVEQFQSAGWAMDFHEAKVKARIRCELPSGWGSVGLMRSPAASHWYGREAHRGALVCTPPGEAIDGRIMPGFSCLSITVPGHVWEAARVLAGVDSSSFGGARIHMIEQGVYGGIERRIHELRRMLRSAGADTRLAAVAGAQAAAFATELISITWSSEETGRDARDSHRNRARLARRAEDWMRAHLGEPIQIPGLCRALGVSRRELEYAFRLIHDESPRDYLHALRLNAVRRELIRKDRTESVSRIALSNGISHFGRFAADYRRMFGGNPGETRRS